MTHIQACAIHLYTLGWLKSEQSVYGICNTALFTEDWDKIEILAPYFKVFTMALNKLQRISGTFWRGVRANIFEQYPVHSLIFWLPFTSTTTSLEILNSEAFLGKTGERTIFSIETDRAVDIRPFSQLQKEEERLVVCGSLFKVATVGNPGEGLHMISLRQESGPTPVPDVVFGGNLKRIQASRVMTLVVIAFIIIFVLAIGVATPIIIHVASQQQMFQIIQNQTMELCNPVFHRIDGDCVVCDIPNVRSYTTECFIDTCNE